MKKKRKIYQIILDGLKKLSIFIADRATIAAENINKQQNKESTMDYFKDVVRKANAPSSNYMNDVVNDAENKLFNSKF